MPGSNEYSKAPEHRTGASNSKTAPVSTVKKESTNPSKDLIAMKMKTIPGEINVTNPLSKPAPTQSRLDMDIRHHAAKTLSKPASLQSQVDMDLTHVLAKMPDELKQEMVTHGTKLINKPKWSATNASVDAGATTYKVQAGNTLGQIVADYNKKNGTALKWQDVAKWNNIDPSKMRIGQVINFADPTSSPASPATQTPVVPPTPVAPQNPVVTPTDTVAVTTPRDTVKVAAPRDTAKVAAVDTSKVSQPVDTARVAPVDTAKVAAVDTAKISQPIDTTKAVAVDSSKVNKNTPLPQTAPTTESTPNFNLYDFYWLNDDASFNSFVGTDYVRYDPKGFGDFYVDKDGRIYEATLGGAVGKEISQSSTLQHTSPYYHDTKRGKAYRALRTLLTNSGAVLRKQGGTMNRINYFQQGGAAPQQQDLQQQIIALVQAAMQGDQKATETVNKIMEAAKAGDQQAAQLAQMIQQVVEQMKGQATAAKWGAKLGYIRSLKYAKGGKACPACEKGKQIEMKACGGKKAKKRYFGGLV